MACVSDTTPPPGGSVQLNASAPTVPGPSDNRSGGNPRGRTRTLGPGAASLAGALPGPDFVPTHGSGTRPHPADYLRVSVTETEGAGAKTS